MNIPAGVRDGTRIRLAGKGEDGPLGGPPGDLYVVTRVIPSPVFTQRPDGNLEVTVPITIAEAIQGATVEVPDAERLEAHPGSRRDPARHGPAAARRGPAEPGGGGRGDIRYRLEIEIPSDLAPSSGSALDEFAKRSTTTTRASGSCARRRAVGAR